MKKKSKITEKMRKLVEKVRKSKNSNHFTQQRSHPWLAENQETKEA